MDRARRLAALGDPARLAIADALATSDHSPVELVELLAMESNLLAHHLDVLESVGLIRRTVSNGDRRRRYLHLIPGALEGLLPTADADAHRPLFVCTHKSARSQLAAALWKSVVGLRAESAGTHPAERVHPEAVNAARRAGISISGARPKSIDLMSIEQYLVITVCDRAHEEMGASEDWLHWSIPDPLAVGTPEAFDETVHELRERIHALSGE